MSVPPPRVVSLLPGATEMVAALGGADQLIGISHECDFPATIRHLPRVTTTPIESSAGSAAIDAAVRAAVSEGRPVIGVDAGLLRSLAPDLILTQSLCEVCAVSDGIAHRLAAALDPAPGVLALEGRTVDGVFDDLHRVARSLGIPHEGAALVQSLRTRFDALRQRFRRERPVATVVIEWLDPCYLAGHWTPELVAAAGGRDIAVRPGAHSMPRDWRDVVALDPEMVVIALCGFDAARAQAELAALDRPEVHRWLAERRVGVIDGNAYTSRAGPRLVDAVEVLAETLDVRR